MAIVSDEDDAKANEPYPMSAKNDVVVNESVKKSDLEWDLKFVFFMDSNNLYFSLCVV